MTNRPPPTMPKWIFIVADLLLLAVCAWTIQQVLPLRTTGAYLVVAVAIIAWMVGAYLCVWPWVLEFKAQAQQIENETLATALQQLERLEEVGAKVQNATSSWQSAQDAAVRVTTTAREIEEKIKADSKDFMEFAERVNNDEKQHLKLEVEKLRRAEAEWLQVAARMLDHTFALTQAANRSGQANVVNQMANFQSACRDAARRVGLIPFTPAIGDAFDDRTQQLEDPNLKPEAGALVAEILATGFSFQGQLLRRSLVRVLKPEPEPQIVSPVEEGAAEEMPAPEEPVAQVEPQVEEAEEVRESDQPIEQSMAVEEEIDSPSLQPSPEGERHATDAPMEEEKAIEVTDAPSAEENIAEASGVETQVEEEKPRRRQRRPDPQTSLPF